MHDNKYANTYANTMDFKVGQIWTYNQNGHSLMILKIEAYGDTDCVHIRINEPYIIEHMPMSIESLRKSVLQIVSENNQIPDFEDGYSNWKSHHGGIFTISVEESVKTCLKAAGIIIK
jgi:hypothetical protein